MVAPVLTSLSPASVDKGAGVTTVSITGSGFDLDCDVQADGATQGSNYVSDTLIELDVDPTNLAQGSLEITVVNGDDEVSNALQFTIEGASTGVSLLDELIAGNLAALETASDNDLYSVRIQYEQWAESAAAQFKATTSEVIRAIDHELVKRGLK
jgi:hypothetical protein